MGFTKAGDVRTVYSLFTVMTWKVGNGVVFPLYHVVRQALGWHAGQLLIARVHVPYFTLRVAQPERIIPIDTFGPEVLPPSWPGKDDNHTTPEVSNLAGAGPSTSHQSPVTSHEE